MELICSRSGCAFRVHERYFREKSRFMPGICPNCSGPIRIVQDHTDTLVVGRRIETDPGEHNFGLVVEV